MSTIHPISDNPARSRLGAYKRAVCVDCGTYATVQRATGRCRACQKTLTASRAWSTPEGVSRATWALDVVETGRQDEWRWGPTEDTQARCRGRGDLWFASDAGQGSLRARAVEVCDGCPVRDHCAIRGVPEPHGIWGGTTEHDRRSARRARNRAITKNPVLP